MHEMHTIVTDVFGVCPSVCPSVSLSVCHAAQLGFAVRGSFGTAFAKSLWPLVSTGDTTQVATPSRRRLGVNDALLQQERKHRAI